MTSHSRPSKDEYFLRGAEWSATRGTCIRRQVGCILVNSRGHILATGYNGVEAGAPHCNEVVVVRTIREFSFGNNEDIIKNVTDTPYACKGAKAASGQGLEDCDAIHAEQNALLQCGDVFEIETCYVTHSPCVHCVKLLMGTSCKRIVFRQRYAHDEAAQAKWLRRNNQVDVHSAKPHFLREWLHLPDGSGK